ncbi:archaellin/type IV pilin N-terminal domain-containing protein [Methanoregula sp.]|uniref:archaellin/type IV pilin N-terminal domain-containing protein n=1 Tax=Methanoregula sp. TaxID=2052170 RepID=UPI003BB05029
MTRPLNDQGVSVIIGTLLLILIVVTAAAALALMVSQLQKNEMTQQSHLAAVKAENVQFASVNFQNDPVAWSQPPYNITTSGNWSSVTLHLVNLNTDDVNIIAIAVSGSGSGNAQYASNITVINATLNGLPQQQRYNQSSAGTFNLDIPGTQSREIQINFTDGFPSSSLYIGTHDQVRIMIMTSLNNFFEQTFKPPNPIVQSSIATESLGVLQRDVLVLDGSQSTSDNTISTWNWTIVNAANAYPPGSGNCGDTLNLTNPVAQQGKTIRYNPAVPGPFCVNLTVTDNVGMMATSNYISIPADTQFSPPANIVATYNSPPFVNVTIRDINGNSVQGAVVNYIAEQSQQYGNLTLNDYVGTTDINGMNSTNITCGIGTVKVVSGQLSPIEVAVRAPNTGC